MKYKSAIFHQSLKQWFCRIFLFAVLFSHVKANSSVREWKLKDGRFVNGEIVTVDEEKRTLILRLEGDKEVNIKIDDLQNIDKAWLTEWIEMNEELADKVKSLGGRFNRHEAKGEKYITGYYVYEPSSRVKSGVAGPMCMLFCPSGKPVRYLFRHVAAAEAANVTLVTADYFRNHIPDEESNGRFKELYPFICSTVNHNSDQFFMGGPSGGALRAFRLAAHFPNIKIAGIYSNGGWLGQQHQASRDYPKMRVALVNGDKDSAANHYNDMVTKILQARGCTVSMFAFEGGHQVSPDSVQTKTFRWLLGEFQ